MKTFGWFLLIPFFFINLKCLFQWLNGMQMSWFHAVFWLISIFGTAIAAGIIWGGLFQGGF